MIFISQVYAEVRKRKRNLVEVLAAGGRYDDLVQRLYLPDVINMRPVASHENENSFTTRKHCAFGVSIAIEKVNLYH